MYECDNLIVRTENFDYTIDPKFSNFLSNLAENGVVDLRSDDSAVVAIKDAFLNVINGVKNVSDYVLSCDYLGIMIPDHILAKVVENIDSYDEKIRLAIVRGFSLRLASQEPFSQQNSTLMEKTFPYKYSGHSRIIPMRYWIRTKYDGYSFSINRKGDIKYLHSNMYYPVTVLNCPTERVETFVSNPEISTANLDYDVLSKFKTIPANVKNLIISFDNQILDGDTIEILRNLLEKSAVSELKLDYVRSDLSVMIPNNIKTLSLRASDLKILLNFTPLPHVEVLELRHSMGCPSYASEICARGWGPSVLKVGGRCVECISYTLLNFDLSVITELECDSNFHVPDIPNLRKLTIVEFYNKNPMLFGLSDPHLEELEIKFEHRSNNCTTGNSLVHVLSVLNPVKTLKLRNFTDSPYSYSYKMMMNYRKIIDDSVLQNTSFMNKIKLVKNLTLELSAGTYGKYVVPNDLEILCLDSPTNLPSNFENLSRLKRLYAMDILREKNEWNVGGKDNNKPINLENLENLELLIATVPTNFFENVPDRAIYYCIAPTN